MAKKDYDVVVGGDKGKKNFFLHCPCPDEVDLRNLLTLEGAARFEIMKLYQSGRELYHLKSQFALKRIEAILEKSGGESLSREGVLLIQKILDLMKELSRKEQDFIKKWGPKILSINLPQDQADEIAVKFKFINPNPSNSLAITQGTKGIEG